MKINNEQRRTRTEHKQNTNRTRTEHEQNTNRTRTEHEQNLRHVLWVLRHKKIELLNTYLCLRTSSLSNITKGPALLRCVLSLDHTNEVHSLSDPSSKSTPLPHTI
ncbi:hypothetical protein Glove_416g13 [Diversispora epigaea]|uniref:Uncharacterized protein n=1 Tax=Diversispora epigaea TaxID=1348612 RepID=A0A397GWK1_9GLOM|nr:hypothetical protein Glove_416g13 [Diversispora epigaea]